MMVSARPDQRIGWGWDVALLVGLVMALYLPRLTSVPLRGEETRWGTVARHMVRSGDWVVPHQQGVVFAERPPLGSWLVAGLATMRGSGVDAWDVRVPSVLAVMGTVLLIYGCGRVWLTRVGAVGAGVVYLSFGQVLQLGRLGETEALFAFFVGGSILLWYAAYVKKWRPWVVWGGAYVLVAGGMLTKGLQAPAYFGAAVGAHLLLRRDFRMLFSGGHLIGFGVFLALVGGWAIPFYQATDGATFSVLWLGLAEDRYAFSGLVMHVLRYPFETFGCLLPWSPLLIELGQPRFREAVRERLAIRGLLRFLLMALAVTFPTVWFAAEAECRYFMPMYPLLALLIGGVIEVCGQVGEDSPLGKAWWEFRGGAAVVCGGLGGLLMAESVFSFEFLREIGFSSGMALGLGVAAVGVAFVVWPRKATGGRALGAVMWIGALVGVVFSTIIVSIQLHSNDDLEGRVAALKGELPEGERLVSLGPVHHAFCWWYGDLIPEFPWPETREDISGEWEYFCFEFNRGDTAEERAMGRGRSWTTTTGTLPFLWEEVARVVTIGDEPDAPKRAVIVGRVSIREKESIEGEVNHE